MNFWLSSSAMARPMTVDRMTKPIEKFSVTIAERQKTGLEKTISKFSMPTKVPRLAPFAGTSCRL